MSIPQQQQHPVFVLAPGGSQQLPPGGFVVHPGAAAFPGAATFLPPGATLASHPPMHTLYQSVYPSDPALAHRMAGDPNQPPATHHHQLTAAGGPHPIMYAFPNPPPTFVQSPYNGGGGGGVFMVHAAPFNAVPQQGLPPQALSAPHHPGLLHHLGHQQQPPHFGGPYPPAMMSHGGPAGHPQQHHAQLQRQHVQHLSPSTSSTNLYAPGASPLGQRSSSLSTTTASAALPPRKHGVSATNAITPPMRPAEHDPVFDSEATAEEKSVAMKVIEDLRRDRVDRSVGLRIRTLDPRTVNGLRCVLEDDPSLVMQLCEQERGRIVCSIWERCGGQSCPKQLQTIKANYLSLAVSQRGCIALPRLHTALLPPWADELFQICVDHLPQLACDRYGNYLCNHMVTFGRDDYTERLARRFAEFPELFTGPATDKYGSFVVDELLKKGKFANLRPLIERIFLSDEGGLRQLCADPYGNYIVQSALDAALTTRTLPVSTLASFEHSESSADSVTQATPVPPTISVGADEAQAKTFSSAVWKVLPYSPFAVNIAKHLPRS